MQLPKVLLVDDDPASLRALERQLAAAPAARPYQLITAGSDQEALRAVLLHAFCVIVLDVGMPGTDGHEIAAAIRSHPRGAGVPVILIDADGRADAGTDDLPARVAIFVDLAARNLALQVQNEELAQRTHDLRTQHGLELERLSAELEYEARERQLAEERLHLLSTRDALTNLVNRRTLEQQLEHAVAVADRSGAGFALLALDLEQYGQVGASHGADIANELLRQVAARLSAAVRVADIVARLEGDQFVVLIEGRGAAANAARVARKIAAACALPFDIGGRRLKTAARIGVALYPQDGSDAPQLLRHADSARQHAGQDGAEAIQFFHEGLNERERERMQWTRELRAALAAHQLELRYQPQGDLRSALTAGRPSVTGAEALLHWRHPARGLLAAPQFLPHVEDRALLDAIDAWVIGQAAAQAARWPAAGQPRDRVERPCIWLNLATPQLHADVVLTLAAAVRQHGLQRSACGIGVELDESLLHGPAALLARALSALEANGVGAALDDFGGAHSTLAACRRRQLAVLKIDPALVHAIGNDHGGTDLVAAVIHLARAFGMRVTAQGVDHPHQLAALQALHCNTVQGALFSAPLTADELSLYIHSFPPKQ